METERKNGDGERGGRRRERSETERERRENKVSGIEEWPPVD